MPEELGASFNDPTSMSKRLRMINFHDMLQFAANIYSTKYYQTVRHKPKFFQCNVCYVTALTYDREALYFLISSLFFSGFKT